MTTVALLHRDPVLGLRLAETVAAAPDLTVIGVAGSLPALRELLARDMPDLLLVDLMLPALHVHAVLSDLRLQGERGPRLLVLAVSADDPRVMEALRHGADSYYAHAHSPLTLPAAVEQLAHGESNITPQIARQLKSHFDAHAGAIGDTDRRLLQWIAEGFLISEVARALHLSAHAVGVRIRGLYRRLQTDVHAQESLPAYARRVAPG
jgi:DNA-binding NarL/FixJ family response regulator